jgi:hypothetical protein
MIARKGLSDLIGAEPFSNQPVAMHWNGAGASPPFDLHRTMNRIFQDGGGTRKDQVYSCQSPVLLPAP